MTSLVPGIVARAALVVFAIVLTSCGPSAESVSQLDAAPPKLVAADGSYETVPLAKDVVIVKVVQNGVRNLQDFATVEEGLSFNLERMVGFVERACTEGRQPDFILFNEFPLTGYSRGTRDQKLKFTLRIPGPETVRLGEAAKACETYLIFGSYAADDAWPGHILSINVVIGPDGEIHEQYWKSRNVTRLDADGEIPTTTVESVRDKYRARYGMEEEFPVLRTPYGNIAVSTVQIDPMIYAAFAMRGTEIMFRTSTLFSKIDVQAIAYFNNMYSAMSNITFPPDGPYAEYGGGSLIVDPRGRVLAEDPSNDESILEAEIPIAEFRAGRSIPRYPMEVVAPVFEQYQQELPLNHMDIAPEDMPQTREAMKDLIDRESRWLN